MVTRLDGRRCRGRRGLVGWPRDSGWAWLGLAWLGPACDGLGPLRAAGHLITGIHAHPSPHALTNPPSHQPVHPPTHPSIHPRSIHPPPSPQGLSSIKYNRWIPRAELMEKGFTKKVGWWRVKGVAIRSMSASADWGVEGLASQLVRRRLNACGTRFFKLPSMNEPLIRKQGTF